MQTVKERGVWCIASAHGDLRSLVRNKQLNGLVGGVETVTLGDGQARHEQRKNGGPFSKVMFCIQIKEDQGYKAAPHPSRSSYTISLPSMDYLYIGYCAQCFPLIPQP